MSGTKKYCASLSKKINQQSQSNSIVTISTLTFEVGTIVIDIAHGLNVGNNSASLFINTSWDFSIWSLIETKMTKLQYSIQDRNTTDRHKNTLN